jgi:predicted aspartyl protease
MRSAVVSIVLAAASLFATPLHAQDSARTAATTAPTTPDESLLQLGQAQERMTVPVSIGGSGPYRFIVDTGSQRTVISRELAVRLGLAAGSAIRITAMTGASLVGTVIVPELSVSKISRTTITAPVLEAVNMGAPGILGVDTLQGHAVTIDFDRNEMSLRPVKGRRTRYPGAADEVVVVAKNLFGQLIVTDAHYRGRRISVVIDTGAPLSIGNLALRASMARHPPRPLGQTEVTSVTGGVLSAEYALVDQLDVGGIGLRNVPIGFVDAAPFARFGLADTPALMLGMDVLRLFRSVQIDFVSRQIRFLFPRSAQNEGFHLRNR